MKRSTLAATGILAVLALSACTAGGTATPLPTPPGSTPLPSSTVTPSVRPTPAASGTTTTPRPRRSTPPATPRATPTSASEVSGALGTLPAGFTLPDEDRPATEEVSAFTTTVWSAACPDRTLRVAAASGITASRIKQSVGPEQAVGNGMLQFRDEAAAKAFMDELATALAACPAEGDDEEGYRTVQASGALAGLGDQGVEVRQWSQWNSQGVWSDAPGAGMQYLARKGSFVALTFEGGEFSGDPGASAALRAGFAARITQMLAQV